MKKFSLAIAATAAVLALGACDKRSAESVKSAATDRDMLATFDGSCQAAPAWWVPSLAQNFTGAKVIMQKQSYSFNPAEARLTTTLYSDATCNNKVIQFVESGPYNNRAKVGQTHSDSAQDGSHNLKLDFSKETATAYSKDGVDLANAMSLCGNTNYQDGKSQDITAKAESCAGGKVRSIVYLYKYDAQKNLVLSTEVDVNQKSTPSGIGAITTTYQRQ